MVSVTTTPSDGRDSYHRRVRTIGGAPDIRVFCDCVGVRTGQAAIVQPPPTGYNNIVVALHLEP
jgi:hypothetical protein